MAWTDYLQFTSAWCTILTTVFSGYAAFALWRQRRLHRARSRDYPGIENFARHFSHYREKVSERPYVLSVNLLPNLASALPEIKSFYQSHSMSMPSHREINIPGIMDLPGDLEKFLNAVRAKRHELDGERASEVHLFFAGPVTAAIYLGAALEHWKLIKMYQKNSATQQYEYWGILRK